MSKDKTEHYGLSQWDKTDDFVRAEFNEDNSKIDTALGALQGVKCEMEFGSYDGDGAVLRQINLGFAPKAVFINASNGRAFISGTGVYGGLALAGLPIQTQSMAIEANATGFAVGYQPFNYVRTNEANTTYYYLAFR